VQGSRDFFRGRSFLSALCLLFDRIGNKAIDAGFSFKYQFIINKEGAWKFPTQKKT
jgi:hypothetical protein